MAVVLLKGPSFLGESSDSVFTGLVSVQLVSPPCFLGRLGFWNSVPCSTLFFFKGC